MASQLSPRQREILELVAEGRTSKEIAATLGISESTVNWHLANAFERLGASSRAEAVALAIRSDGANRPQAQDVPALAPAPARYAWPRLLAIAIAIAIAGALLGGATVATLHLGPAPAATPANGSDRGPAASPASGSDQDVVGGEIGPVGGASGMGADPTPAPLRKSPVTAVPIPAVSAPPLPTVPVTLPTPALPTPALPSLPVTPPPLPGPSLPVPIPTPTLPIP